LLCVCVCVFFVFFLLEVGIGRMMVDARIN